MSKQRDPLSICEQDAGGRRERNETESVAFNFSWSNDIIDKKNATHVLQKNRCSGPPKSSTRQKKTKKSYVTKEGSLHKEREGGNTEFPIDFSGLH